MASRRSTNAPDDSGVRLLRLKGAAQLLGITRHTLRRIILDPRSGFPPFIELAPGIRMVRECDVLFWLAKKRERAYAIAGRRDEAVPAPNAPLRAGLAVAARPTDTED